VGSPLRRTIQTAILAFGANNPAEIHLLPEAQEVSGMPCNVGFLREELKEEVKKLFKGDEESEAAAQRINYDAVVDGWNSKVCLT
jgi:broad specificity phosphatase PhoE